MRRIVEIKGREILDSRGNPTVEVDVVAEGGVMGRAAVPSGASTGEHEAVELRDGERGRYGGMGVLRAVEHVNGVIGEALKGWEVTDQAGVDRVLVELDGTRTRANLGANALLGVSLACAKAGAMAAGMPLYRYVGGCGGRVLPVPMMNIVNGGRHSDAPVAFQEFMIRPVRAGSFREAVRMGAEVFHVLRGLLKGRGLGTGVGDEGGFAPRLGGTEEVLEVILEAVEKAGYRAGEEVILGLDCASSEFFREGMYDYGVFEGTGGRRRTTEEQAEYLAGLVERYPIDSIEDGMAENDWEGWRLLTDRLGRRCQLVGDDLFVTNVEYLRRGIESGCGNALLVKVNQVGTLTEALEAMGMAQRAGYAAVVSHRSGETEDVTIADLAVGMNAGQIKTGSMCRTDRMAKYNRLLRIEEELGAVGRYGL